MEKFEIGDLVVLTAGSMRMAVEAVEGEKVACVWCHEGAIGRDAFNPKLLKRWEFREDAPSRGPRDEGGPRGPRAEREGKPRGHEREGRPPRGRTGWDGKPREKKYFRSE